MPDSVKSEEGLALDAWYVDRDKKSSEESETKQNYIMQELGCDIVRTPRTSPSLSLSLSLSHSVRLFVPIFYPRHTFKTFIEDIFKPPWPSVLTFDVRRSKIFVAKSLGSLAPNSPWLAKLSCTYHTITFERTLFRATAPSLLTLSRRHEGTISLRSERYFSIASIRFVPVDLHQMRV